MTRSFQPSDAIMLTLKQPARIAALVLAAPLLLGACGGESEPADAEDVKQEARELGETLESYTAAQRDEALEKAQAALADLTERIDALEQEARERWADMDEQARERTEEDLESLEAQRSKAAEWFERMKDGSGEAWEHLSQGFADAMAALRASWQEAQQEVESESGG